MKEKGKRKLKLKEKSMFIAYKSILYNIYIRGVCAMYITRAYLHKYAGSSNNQEYPLNKI